MRGGDIPLGQHLVYKCQRTTTESQAEYDCFVRRDIYNPDSRRLSPAMRQSPRLLVDVQAEYVSNFQICIGVQSPPVVYQVL